jgi:hypothetical protein
MVLVFPGTAGFFKGFEHPEPPYLFPSSLGKEAAAAPLPDECINLFGELLGYDYMGSFAHIHMIRVKDIGRL